MRYPISDCESLRRAIIFSDQSSFMMKSNTFKTMIAYLSQLSNKRNHLSTVCFTGRVWHFIQTFKNRIQLNSLYLQNADATRRKVQCKRNVSMHFFRIELNRNLLKSSEVLILTLNFRKCWPNSLDARSAQIFSF